MNLKHAIEQVHELRWNMRCLKEEAEPLRQFIIEQGGGQAGLLVATVAIVHPHVQHIGQHARLLITERNQP